MPARVAWLSFASGLACVFLGACSLLVSTDDYVGSRPPDAAGERDAGGTDPTAGLPSSLFLYYPFEGDFRDMAGNGRDGLAGGPTVHLDPDGAIGAAVTCATQGDQVNVGAAEFRPGTGSFTVALYFRIHVVDGFAVRRFNSLFVKGGVWEDSTSRRAGFGLGFADDPNNPANNQSLRGFLNDGEASHSWVISQAYSSDSLPLKDGRFHHVAFVVQRDASTQAASLYVDGQIRDRATVPAAFGSVDSSDTGRLCTETAAPQIALDGSIDEFMLFERALSDGEVASLAARAHR